MLNATNTAAYTDFSSLAKLKNEARNNSPEALKEVAKQFEAIFLNNVLKGMREAKLADGIADSDQSKFYNEMYDQQLAVHLSGKPGVGLADLIVKQLSHEQPDNKKMALEDYLNRSGSYDETRPTQSSLVERQAGRNLDSKIASDLAIFKSYLSDKGSVKAINNSRSSQQIRSAEDFVQKLYPYAIQAAKQLGVEPKVLLAQAALETGWGRSVIKNSDGSSFNLFNIKASKGWHGEQIQVSTLEFEQGVAKKVNAGFRAYASFQESFQDYVGFIKNNPRYGIALQQVGNGERYLQELQRAGYATDPSYAKKVMNIYHSNAMAQIESQTVAMR